MSIRLITFSGQTVTPKTDGIIQDASIGQNGIFYGCGVTASGNSLHIDGGYGLIKGRYFEIDATTVPVTLATSDALLGRLYVKLDLSNTEAPIQILTATGETLPSLEQDADANFDDGVWEMELATFNITTTEISDFTETYQTITDNASLVSALQTAVDTLNSNLNAANIVSIRRVAMTETTGASGNIALSYENVGNVFVIAPYATGSSTYLRAWVSGTNNKWYLTAIDPNTGATQNNKSLSIRYLVVTIKNL